MCVVRRERDFSEAINRYEGNLVVRNHKAYDESGRCVIELDREVSETTE